MATHTHNGVRIIPALSAGHSNEKGDLGGHRDPRTMGEPLPSWRAQLWGKPAHGHLTKPTQNFKTSPDNQSFTPRRLGLARRGDSPGGLGCFLH